MRLVAVDPGLRDCGIAFFDSGLLVTARLVRSPERRARGGAAWVAMGWAIAPLVVDWRGEVAVIEDQVQYEGASAFADREDITELSHAAGAVALVLSAKALELRTPKPREWKGQVPKDVHGRRILSRLTPAEAGRVTWPKETLRHNVTDAIGLGLWAIGRL